MAKIEAVRVWETTTSTGTGDIVTTAAVLANRRFSSVCAIGDLVDYIIAAVDANGNDSGDWEVGTGTYSAANTITRTSVEASSNGNAPVNFVAGTKRVGLTLAAASIGPAIGQVVETAGFSNLPGTYLRCDGRAYPRATYPLLAPMFPSTGINITDSASPTPALSPVMIAYGNGLYIGVYNANTLDIITSVDGVTWTTQPSKLTAFASGTTAWTGIYFVGGQFIAIARGTISTSPDGVTWTARTPPSLTTAYSAVFYNATNSTYLLVLALSTTAAYSTDGAVTWTTCTLGLSPNNLYQVMVGAGLFVVFGSSSLFTSPNGVTWTQRSSVTFLSAVGVYDQSAGLFSIFGTVQFNAGYLCYTSTDGITWTLKTTTTNPIPDPAAFPPWGPLVPSLTTYHPTLGAVVAVAGNAGQAGGFLAPPATSFFASKNGGAWTLVTSVPYTIARFISTDDPTKFGWTNTLSNNMTLLLHTATVDTATFNVPLMSANRSHVIPFIRAK